MSCDYVGWEYLAICMAMLALTVQQTVIFILKRANVDLRFKNDYLMRCAGLTVEEP